MNWHHPVPLRLVVTDDRESFRTMPANTTGIPVGEHPGAFGVKRKHHTHEGVDLYVPEFTTVMAVEDGVVVKVAPFTGLAAGLPWWRDTQAVFVEGASGVVVYGEIEPFVKEGDELIAGQSLGRVIRVLVADKGRPTCMLHLELHSAGSRAAPEWLDHEAKPSVLRDPTPYLMGCLSVQDDETESETARASNDHNPLLWGNMEDLARLLVDKPSPSDYNPLLRVAGDAPAGVVRHAEIRFNPFFEGLDSEKIAARIADLLPQADDNSFLQARRFWLRNLPTALGEGWLAGGGKVTGTAPSKEAAICASDLLDKVMELPATNPNWARDGGLLMGALPAGGISFEIRWEDGKRYSVNIFNTGVVDLEVLGRSESTEHTSTFADVPSALVGLMKGSA